MSGSITHQEDTKRTQSFTRSTSVRSKRTSLAGVTKGPRVAKKNMESTELKHKSLCKLSVFAVVVIVIVMVLLVVILVEIIAIETSSSKADDIIVTLRRQRSNSSSVRMCIRLGSMTLRNAMFNYTSCADIFRRNPSSSSGYYYVGSSSTGSLNSVYCSMGVICGGGDPGGWARVSRLDFNTDICPVGFKWQALSALRCCVMKRDEAGCSSVYFSSLNMSYSKVCGQVRGYAIGTPDGFFGIRKGRRTKDYFDGIIVFSGEEHVWSFVVGICHCDLAKAYFIGKNWTCDETRCSQAQNCDKSVFSRNDCGQKTPFYRELSKSTSVDVELRMCRNMHRLDEEIAMGIITLYIQ